MTNKQKEFLQQEFWMLAWNASVQRNKTYSENASDAKKNKFRKDLIAFLNVNILPQYTKPIDENKHLRNLAKIVDKANEIGADILFGSYKFGASQKLLNLILKYYWCQNWMPEPPHCPIDNVIIKQLKINIQTNWTDPEFDMNDYKSAITQINNKASGFSVAQCELQYFNRR